MRLSNSIRKKMADLGSISIVRLWKKWKDYADITLKKIVILLLIVFVAYQYLSSLIAHGTFFPLMTFAYTSVYEGGVSRNYLTDAEPPAYWNTNARIVVTMSTMPQNIIKMNETINSILKQTLRPHVIYINVPYINKRTNISYVVPPWLEQIELVKVLRGPDYGPITKLVPVFDVEKDPNTIIISVDDDKM